MTDFGVANVCCLTIQVTALAQFGGAMARFGGGYAHFPCQTRSWGRVKLGARSVVPKDSATQMLLKAIHTVMAGEY
jgi:hypothetical protein